MTYGATDRTAGKAPMPWSPIFLRVLYPDYSSPRTSRASRGIPKAFAFADPERRVPVVPSGSNLSITCQTATLMVSSDNISNLVPASSMATVDSIRVALDRLEFPGTPQTSSFPSRQTRSPASLSPRSSLDEYSNGNKLPYTPRYDL